MNTQPVILKKIKAVVHFDSQVIYPQMKNNIIICDSVRNCSTVDTHHKIQDYLFRNFPSL